MSATLCASSFGRNCRNVGLKKDLCGASGVTGGIATKSLISVVALFVSYDTFECVVVCEEQGGRIISERDTTGTSARSFDCCVTLLEFIMLLAPGQKNSNFSPMRGTRRWTRAPAPAC